MTTSMIKKLWCAVCRRETWHTNAVRAVCNVCMNGRVN